jgi:hypothetical protein
VALLTGLGAFCQQNPTALLCSGVLFSLYATQLELPAERLPCKEKGYVVAFAAGHSAAVNNHEHDGYRPAA